LPTPRINAQVQPGGSEVGHDGERKVEGAREPNRG
jgi:hypothetical protein